jgi:hypothetical protein
MCRPKKLKNPPYLYKRKEASLFFFEEERESFDAKAGKGKSLRQIRNAM